MAFSKAKILRFNDIQTCAPPPGAYNPKYDELLSKTPSKTPGRSKKETIEPPSPASSWSDVKSVRSCISNFRTPTIPIRKKLNLFSSAGKKSTSVKLFTPEKVEELKEKIVECHNKDETIKDLEIQIDELKLGISQFKTEKNNLIEEKNAAVKQVEEYQTKLDLIQSQLHESNTINEDMHKNLLLLKEETNTMKQYRDNLQPLMENKLEQKSKYCETLEKEIQENRQEITKLKTEHEEEIDNLNLVKNKALEELNIVRKESEEVNLQLEESILENEDTKQTYKIVKQGLDEVKETQDRMIPFLQEKFNMKTNYCETLEKEIQEMTNLKTKYEEELDNLNLVKNEALEELNIVRKELEEVNLKLEESILENEDTKQTYKMVKQGLDEVKETQDRMIPFLEEKLNIKTNYCETLEKEIQENRQEMTNLKTKHEEELDNLNLVKNEALEELNTVRKELEEVNLQLEETVLENENTKQTFKMVKQGLDEVKETQDRMIPFLEEKLNIKTNYCETLEKEIQENRQEMTNLKTKHEEELDNLNLVKNEALEELNIVRKELEEVNLQLEETVLENENTKQTFKMVKQGLDEVKETQDRMIPFLEEKLNMKTNYCETLEKEIQENRQEIAKLKSGHEDELDNLNLVKNEALEELNIVQKELEDVNIQLEQTVLENENIKETYKMVKQGLDEVKVSQDIIRPLLEEKLNLKINYCEALEQELQEREEEIEEIKMKHTEEIDNVTIEKHEALAHLEIVQTKLDDVNKQLMQTVLENDLKETYEMLEESEAREVHDLVKPFIEEYEEQLKDAQDKLDNKTKYCELLEVQLQENLEDMDKIKKQYEESLQTQADIQEWYATNTESIKKQYQTEIEDMEYEILKIVTESQKKLSQTEKDAGGHIKELETHYENIIEQIKNDVQVQIIQLKNDTEAQVRQSEEDCSEKIKLAEIQMEETCKVLNRSWELKLNEQELKSADILKECQAIAEFSIIQCEVEKNETKKRLEENEQYTHNLKLENTELKSEMSQIIIELNDTRAKLGSEIDKRQKDLETAFAEIHCYEITLNKTYNTVNALKTRLLHSDRDVEQLKDELELLEISKLETECKYLQLTEEVQHIKRINEHLKCENLMLKEIQDKVIVLERELLEKVDNLKLKSDLEITKLNKIINEKQTTIDELNSFIQNQQKLHSGLDSVVVDARNELDRQENEFIEYKFKISRLEASLNSSNKEILLQGKTLEKKLKYIDQLEDKLKEKDNQIDEISSTYKKYVDRTRHLSDLQQKNEILSQKCINLEKMVVDQKKVADPIRYLIQPKKNKSTENKIDYEDKIIQQNKTIENLKQELAHLSKKRRSKSMVSDKENVCSPVRSQVLNSLMDSPASPLKERN